MPRCIASLQLNVSVLHTLEDRLRRACFNCSYARASTRPSRRDARGFNIFHSVLNGLPANVAPSERLIAVPRAFPCPCHERRRRAKKSTRPVTHEHTGNPAAQ
ncbi:MAG: hypothetical protein OSB41_15725 [Kiritimatiellae bacterium]|nr:hypothetical protein [Kiritimatiellia bacterium]